MRLTTAFIVAGVIGTLTTSPAHAHTELERSIPSASATVRSSLTDVRLTFNQPLGSGPATVNVLDPDGNNLAEGRPRTQGSQVIQAIGELSTRGKHQVAYRVVSLDGHPITGSYTFRFVPPTPAEETPTASAEETPAASAEESPAAAPPPAQAPHSEASGSTGLLVPAVGAGVVAALIAAGALLARRRRQGAV